MYKYQVKRLLKKQWILLLVIVLTAAAGKLFALKINQTEGDLTAAEQQILDGYVEETLNLTADQKLDYIVKKQTLEAEKFAALENPTADQTADYNEKSNAQSEYKNSLTNVYTLLGVQKYANTGEGLVSPSLPQNFYETKRAYLDINEPNVINEYHYKRFIAMQSYSFLPIFVLLTVGIFTADTYEKRINLQAKISKNSRLFFRSQEVTLSVFILILLILNTVSDMAISGLLTHRYELNVPLQSVSDYIFFPTNITIGQSIIFLFLLQMFGAFICYHAFTIAAQTLNSTRNYMIFGLSVVVMVTLVARFFPGISPYLVMGITDKRSVLNAVKYLPKFGASDIFIVLTLCLMQISGVCAWRFCGYYEKGLKA